MCVFVCGGESERERERERATKRERAKEGERAREKKGQRERERQSQSGIPGKWGSADAGHCHAVATAWGLTLSRTP